MATPELTGTLSIALATADGVSAKGFPLASHPAITKTRAAKSALNLLRLAMLRSPIGNRRPTRDQ